MAALRNMMLILMVISLLVSTSGARLIWHICGCEHVQEGHVSSCCQPAADAHDNNGHSCCSGESCNPVRFASHGTDPFACTIDCCQEIEITSNISEYNLPSQPEVNKAVVFDLPGTFSSKEAEPRESGRFIIQDYPDKSPPPSGLQLLRLIHQFRFCELPA